MKDTTKMRSLLNEVIDVVTFSRDLKGTIRGKSYADANRLATLEPYLTYSRDLQHEDYLEAIQQLGLSIFVSYYLVAVQSVASIHRAKVIKVMSSVNPEVGLESFEMSLDNLRELPMLATESEWEGKGQKKKKKKNWNVSGKVTSKDGATAIGKEVEVSIMPTHKDSKGKKIKEYKINTFVKMINIPIDNDVIAGQLSLKRRDNDFSERWMKLRAGRISFWEDFLFAEDLIKEEKRLHAHPDAEVFAKIKERHRAGLLKTIRGKGDSFGVGSNVIVISQDVLNKIEHQAKHSITSGSMLDEIFSGLGFMMLFVVDREEEIVTMYFKNINKGSVHTLKSIEKLNGAKKDGPDILSVIRDLSKSDLPNF